MKKLYTVLFAIVAFVSFPAFAQYTMANYTITPGSYETVKEIETVTIHWSGLADGIEAHIIPSNVGEYVNITSGDEVYKAKAMYAGTSTAPTVDDLVLVFDKITAPGTYTLNVAAGIVMDYDQQQSADEGETYSTNGYITATYKIGADSQEGPMSIYILDPEDGAEVTSIKTISIEFPETADMDGIDEYGLADEKITITCGDEVYYPVGLDFNDDYTGAEITFDAISEPGTYVLKIEAGTYRLFGDAEPEENELNPEITATYIVTGGDDPDPDKKVMGVYTLDPADGATVEFIDKISIDFPESIAGGYEGINYPMNDITLTCGESVYTSTTFVDSPTFSGGSFHFAKITTPGTYTLHIPAGTFSSYDNGSDKNEEISATYVVTGESGIANIGIAPDGKVTVIDLMGRTVLKDASVKAIDSLDAGIYIVNGHKVAVK